MKKNKVMIVDDSSFSRTLLADSLEKNGYEVVGEASTIIEAINTYKEVKPDMVTMDMAMPDADGFQVSEEILKIDPDAKIIIVSSMKDDELVKKAARLNIVGYIQKPVDEEELINALTKVAEEENIFSELNDLYFKVFKESLADNLTRITKLAPVFDEENKNIRSYQSQGISVVVGISGNYSGRMIIDISYDTAKAFTDTFMKREAKSKEEVYEFISEFANIVSGNATSLLNKQNKIFGLRVAPPSIFYGESIEMISPNIDNRCVDLNTDLGKVYINVGFKRGAKDWMLS